MMLCLSSCFVRVNGTSPFNSVSPEGELKTITVIPDGDFSSVSMAGSFDLQIIQSEGPSKIEVTSYESLLPYFEAECDGDILSLRFHSDTVSRFILKDTKAVLYTNTLSGVSLAGSGDITSSKFSSESNIFISLSGSGDISFDEITCSDLAVSVAGSGDIVLSGIKCGNLAASVAGSGDISLSGEAESAKYSVAGSGDIVAVDLKAGNVDSKKAGTGSIKF